MKTIPNIFFEVIKEYDGFAILLRKNPIKISMKTYGGEWNGAYPSAPSVASSSMEVSQIETIYLLDGNGKINKYIEVRDQEDGVESLITKEDRKSRVRSSDTSILSKYITEAMYDKLKVYAAEHDLKFRKKEDFIKILEYYDTLIK